MVQLVDAVMERAMERPVSDAKGVLTDLVRRAEEGEDILLRRHGRPVVRLVPAIARPSASERLAALRAAQAAGRQAAVAGPPAARSQDFLYGDEALPG